MGTDKIYAALENQQEPKDITEGLRQTVDFLIEEGIANNIFVTINVGGKEEKNEFYGSRFGLGKY